MQSKFSGYDFRIKGLNHLHVVQNRIFSKFFIIFLLLSTHRPLHRPVRDDGFPDGIRRQRLRCATDGWEGMETLCAIRIGYRRIHSQGSPSDRRGKRLSGNFHQRDGYVPQAEDRQSGVRSASIHQETPVRFRCLHG